jgi:hypothetical protein
MTDWRNEGYAWYIHNSIMGVTVLATLGLSLSSLFPDVTIIIPDLASSFFTFTLAAQVTFQVILYAFYQFGRDDQVYEYEMLSWKVDFMTVVAHLGMDLLILDWLLNSIEFTLNPYNFVPAVV